MFKDYVEPVLIFILEALWNFKWVLGTLLVAWLMCSALNSWMDDMEQAAKRMHQMPYRYELSQQINTQPTK